MRNQWLWAACIAAVLPLSSLAQKAVTTNGNQAQASTADNACEEQQLDQFARS